MTIGQTVCFKYDTVPAHLTAHTKRVRTVTNERMDRRKRTDLVASAISQSAGIRTK